MVGDRIGGEQPLLVYYVAESVRCCVAKETRRTLSGQGLMIQVHTDGLAMNSPKGAVRFQPGPSGRVDQQQSLRPEGLR